MRGRARSSRPLPWAFLVTDADRLPDPLPAARRLPAGCGVILRHYGAHRREALAHRLARVCRARRLVLLIAGDAQLAERVRAHGIHLPERDLRFPVHRGAGWRRRRPRWIVTAAAHSLAAIHDAARRGADAVLLAPVFPTASHSDRRTLGSIRFAAMARRSRVPVYALGGVNACNIRALAASGACGIGALAGLAVPG